jgi:hypothetical protein
MIDDCAIGQQDPTQSVELDGQVDAKSRSRLNVLRQPSIDGDDRKPCGVGS